MTVAYLLSRRSAAKTEAEAPVGTGPFTFVEWMPDDHVTLVANENYWDGSYKGKPMVDTVTFRPIPEAATRAAELEPCIKTITPKSSSGINTT